MNWNDTLYDLFESKAEDVTVEIVSLGLGYTAVTTSDGGMGVACTYFDSANSCSVVKDYHDYEGRSAVDLLEKIKSTNTIERSMALALINALNYDEALSLPEDKNNNAMFDTFDICEGTRAAMVGFFGPLINIFKERNVSLEIIDITRGLGRKEDFYEKLEHETDVLFLTSTSILNSTTEEILGHAGKNVKTIMLGPSTPMVPEAFKHLPVHMLAGTVPLEKEKVLKAIRHGTGTPVIHRFSRKSFWLSTD
ncbi:MAG: DUF364 domain-containing protein [Deltaproteobacteria bacterium]|nr:DUF364 domain-containing protein [Deltaproteobacteria bacterium]